MEHAGSPGQWAAMLFQPGVSRNVQLCMLLDAHTLWQMHRRYQLHLGFASVAAELLFCTVIISYSEGKQSIAVQTFKEKHMPVRSEPLTHV